MAGQALRGAVDHRALGGQQGVVAGARCARAARTGVLASGGVRGAGDVGRQLRAAPRRGGRHLDAVAGRGLTAAGPVTGFAHLHVASSYSLRYGTASPAKLAARAAELGMPALALTDRDGLYGAFKHVKACADAGIKPLLGADLAVTGEPVPRSSSQRGRAGRVTLLAT